MGSANWLTISFKEREALGAAGAQEEEVGFYRKIRINA
jgi:hypothetical protein